MATNATTIKNGACWYGLHIGRVNTNDPNRTKCAMRLALRLAHVVNRTLGPRPAWVQSVDAARADTRIDAGLDSPTTYADGGPEAALGAALKPELELRETRGARAVGAFGTTGLDDPLCT